MNNAFGVEEQVGFGSFMARQLNSRAIPWSINTDDKFIDLDSKSWLTVNSAGGSVPVRDAILDSESISLYVGNLYDGASVRLRGGEYDWPDLQAKGFTSAGSIMIPIDYTVVIYSQPGFVGDAFTLTGTISSLGKAIKSLQVLYLPPNQ